MDYLTEINKYFKSSNFCYLLDQFMHKNNISENKKNNLFLKGRKRNIFLFTGKK